MLRRLQDSMCGELEALDGRGRFGTDEWTHEAEGGGTTRVANDGAVFERGAVNHSMVALNLSSRAATRMGVDQQRISATGISVILHPGNPYVPTVHANFRFLELENGTWWFGGGSDLTPFYLNADDVRHFHATWKKVCDAHDRSYHPTYKAWCDAYFYLAHRNEARGVGGIFFDNLKGDFEGIWSFVRGCATEFLPSYVPIVRRRMHDRFEDRHRAWQMQRRGRYVEFNLLYDRGTQFGLDSGGRVESILASLPPMVRWDYGAEVEPGSDEAKLLEVLKKPKDWV